VPAFAANKRASFDLDDSAFDDKVLWIHQEVRHLLMGRRNDVAEGLTRNVHPFGGLFLIEPFMVGEPDGFEFIECQGYLIAFIPSDVAWLEAPYRRVAIDAS
jgi:hypothetical protein